MGQELNTLILFGPNRLEQTGPAWQNAVAKANAALCFLAKYKEAREKENDGDEEAMVAAIADTPLLDYGGLDSVETAEDFDATLDRLGLGKKTAIEIVKSFVEFWNEGSSDSVSRSLPTDLERKAVAVGDSTYGDEPDGEGYQLCKLAEMLDLYGCFGID